MGERSVERDEPTEARARHREWCTHQAVLAEHARQVGLEHPREVVVRVASGEARPKRVVGHVRVLVDSRGRVVDADGEHILEPRGAERLVHGPSAEGRVGREEVLAVVEHEHARHR